MTARRWRESFCSQSEVSDGSACKLAALVVDIPIDNANIVLAVWENAKRFALADQWLPIT